VKHRHVAVVSALALAALFATACGGGAPTCDQLIDHVAEVTKDKPPDRAAAIADCQKSDLSAATKRCLMKAASAEDLGACFSEAKHGDKGGGADDYATSAKASEAELNANRIAKLVKMYYAEQATYPASASGPTPPLGSCCKQPGGTCKPDRSMWQMPPWSTIDFAIDEPSRYSYSYEVKDTSKEVVVHAIGDLDCDGDLSDFAVHITPEGTTTSGTKQGE
jgi:hypothetical protein